MVTEHLRNPIVAGLFGAIVFTALLFAIGFLVNFLRSRFAGLATLTAGQEGQPSEDPLISALQVTVRKLRRRSFRPDVEDWSVPHQKPFPPATEAQIVTAEARIGFPLPPLLRRLYLQVANGGFGPAYGLIGVPGGAVDSQGDDISMAYAERRDVSDAQWHWPQGTLPLIETGGASYLCIDTTSPDLPVLEFVPDSVSARFRPVAPSLHQLLVAWVQGGRTFGDRTFTS